LKKFVQEDIDHTFKLHDDAPILQKIWKIAYGTEQMPPFPSEQWKLNLGFQNEDPRQDYDTQYGKFFAQCLLELIKHPTYFSSIHESAQHNDIPIVLIGILAVRLILELLGWDKAPTNISLKPHTYRRLCGLLFLYEDGIAKEDFVWTSRLTFYKLFFLSFGIMVSVWEAMKAMYEDRNNVYECDWGL